MFYQQNIARVTVGVLAGIDLVVVAQPSGAKPAAMSAPNKHMGRLFPLVPSGVPASITLAVSVKDRRIIRCLAVLVPGARCRELALVEANDLVGGG